MAANIEAEVEIDVTVTDYIILFDNEEVYLNDDDDIVVVTTE